MTATISFLHHCMQGNLEEVKNYVERDKKNPFVKDEHGRTGLLFAIWGNHPKIVKYLLKAAPGIELMRTSNGTLPQTVAVYNERQKIINLFFEVMTAPDFDGKIKQLESPQPPSTLNVRLNSSAVDELRRVYETPKFHQRCEIHKSKRGVLIEAMLVTKKPKPETQSSMTDRSSSDEHYMIIAHASVTDNEPKPETKPPMTDLSSFFEHCVISENKSS